jgi:hypothetical protein
MREGEPGSLLLSKALGLVEDARASGILLRLAGSLAVLSYSERGNRPVPPADIDLVAVNSERADVHRFLNRRGWKLSGGLLLVSEIRDLFIDSEDCALDVYYGAIDGSHLIRISRRRLEGCYPAISVADLLLSKLQRKHMRDVDIWDSCAILHLSGIDERDERVLEATSLDWGLYMGVTENLKVLEGACAGDGEKAVRLRRSVLRGKKTLRWRLRALLGTRIRWWREVYDSRGRESR